MAKYKMHRKRRKVSGVTKHHHHRRRRRMGAISGGLSQVLELAGGITLGAIAGREVANLIGQAIPSAQANPLWVGAAELAAGVIIAKKGKSSLIKGIGYGMIANGGTTAVVATGIISGVPGTMTYKLNGVKPMGNIKYIAGATNRIGETGQSNLAFVAGIKKKSVVG